MKARKKDIAPACPHCETRVEHLIVVQSGWFSDHRVYCCPQCEKILGINFAIP